ncbi:lysM and putative peptidoglycan-binding domain-containing protein 1 [Pleurodeles waltl]|uniref:lysM and putative peptidoglycan-binding domain-containing protein 1 n=1 Tax=Pleurodeles waltl TaxID=8319 RepID=UPI0037096015
MSSSSEEASSGASGLLRGSRTRSYGSLMQSACSPVRQRRVEHQITAGDTLPGLALKYGVTIEQIKRANRLYTNDSIFLKKTLYIPVLTEPKQLSNGLSPEKEAAEVQRDTEEIEAATEGLMNEGKKEACDPTGKIPERATRLQDLSATDFLKNLDSKISVSKTAAVKKLKDCDVLGIGETTVGSSSMSSLQRPRTSHTVSPHTQQRSLLGPVPLTRTTLAATLKDREDEIFKL